LTTLRLALLLTGVWLGALLASWAVATVNFRMVDRVLGPSARPELEQRLAPLPAPERREVLRHLASEINRALFAGFGLLQLAFATTLLLLVGKAGGSLRTLAALVLGLALVQLVLAFPITSLGRSIDFVPRPLPLDVSHRFGGLHAAFVLLDVAKAGLLLALASLLARR
jgi:hypothetical protein